MEENTRQQKARLRESLRALTESLPKDYLARSDMGIRKNLLALNDWRKAQTLFIYVSVGKEPDTRWLIRAALDAGKTVAVPLTLGGGAMEARVIISPNALIVGRYGIPEPLEDSPLLLPAALELAVVPCIAADRQGYRLGHGSGYYDRYLARVSCPTVCLCRVKLLQEELPHDDFDRKADWVITE